MVLYEVITNLPCDVSAGPMDRIRTLSACNVIALSNPPPDTSCTGPLISTINNYYESELVLQDMVILAL